MCSSDLRPLLLLPETAAPVNRPAPDFSTAAEPPAPPRLTRPCGHAGQPLLPFAKMRQITTVYPKKEGLLCPPRERTHTMVASPLTTEILPGEVLFIPPGDKRPLLLLPETAATVNRPAPDFSTAAEPPGTLWCMGKRLVSMYVGTLLPDMAFSAKKPPVASSVSRVCRNEDTGRRITISHPAGKQGASHRTASSLPDSAAPVNRPAPTDPGVCADRTHG